MARATLETAPLSALPPDPLASPARRRSLARRYRRRLIVLGLPVALAGFWAALHRYPAFASLIVDGARDVAQLDVNHSYPRFFFYDGAADAPPKVTHTLAPTNDWRPDEYVGRRAWRDFFYLTKRSEPPPAFPAASASAAPSTTAP